MHNVEDMLVQKNYSKCPLKKRPVNYQFDDDDIKDTIKPLAKTDLLLHTNKMDNDDDEPENLSLKKPETETNISSSAQEDELINVSDYCEDEGVDVDHTDDDSMCGEEEEEDDEMIDCVDVEDNHADDANTTQAAALAAAAAVAAASAAASVVVPTPTYPKYGIQPWNFHMSPYTAEFYRTINNPHLAQQISPLRGELLSPSSPSDSIGSLSPPPHHYLAGRASSVSPPMRPEMIHRPIGVRQMPQSPQHGQHRFMPYALPAYHSHHHHHHQTSPPAYPLSYPPHHHHQQHHHHAPISPAYSDSSYYTMRSLTPESIASPVPEDLSLKHSNNSSSLSSTKSLSKSSSELVEKSNNSNSSSASSITSTTTPIKKEKNGPPRYQCPDCQKSYSTFSGLTKHQQFHCPAAEGNQVKKSFSCKDCDKTYVSLGALKMHIRTHTLPCKCNICGKAFSRPWLLQGHIRTHTGEKPFSCQHCHRAFADRSNLRAHLQTHSDIKKYSCTNCSKTFSRMSLLTKHSEGGCHATTAAAATAINSSTTPVPSEMTSYPLYAEH